LSPTEEVSTKDVPNVEYRPSDEDADEEIRIRREQKAPLPPLAVALEPQERATLQRLAESMQGAPGKRPEEFCAEAALLTAELPLTVRAALAAFARYGTAEGITVIRGLPIEETLPPTPSDNSMHIGETTLTAKAQAVLNHGLGEMVAYEAEGAGRLFQDMVPSRAAIRTQTSLSSGVELELHTEQAFSPLKPRWVSLACLRGAEDAETFVLSARRLLEAFGPLEREMLREPLWTTSVDESFRVGGDGFIAGALRGPFPIIEGDEADPFIRFDQDLDWGISREAEALRHKIIDLYPELRTSHILKEGELLMIDNLRAVHGRSPFRARFDGTDRFIIRSFVVAELTKSRHARPGDCRMIGARFS
jgi:L-asparagine oxygenase